MTTVNQNQNQLDPLPLDPPNSRQRFLDTLKFKPVAKPWLRWGAFLGAGSRIQATLPEDPRVAGASPSLVE